jgi:hypothetical protein
MLYIQQQQRPDAPEAQILLCRRHCLLLFGLPGFIDIPFINTLSLQISLIALYE